MELKTDGGIYITKEEYRAHVIKVMNRQSKEAMLAMLVACLGEDMDTDKAQGAVKDALKLQLQALANMERELFGTPVEKDEEATKE